MIVELKEAKRGYNKLYSKIGRKRSPQSLSYPADLSKQEIINRIPSDKKRILDVGCGYGALADFVAKAGKLREYVGLDISSVMLKMAKAGLHGLPMGLVLGVGEFLPFRECSFDVIVSCGVLAHVVDQERVVNEMSKAVRFGGLLIVTDIRKEWTKAWEKYFPPTLPLLILRWRRVRKSTSIPKGVRNVYLSEKKLRNLITNSGLKILQHQRFAFCPPFRFPILYTPYAISLYERLNRIKRLQELRSVQLLMATK